MKTIQTFSLLILLFAASTYCQEYIAAEIDKGSIPIEIEGPNDLILNGVVGPEGVSSVLPSQETPTQDIEVNSPESPQKEDDIPETISEIQASSSIPIDLEPSTENPQEIPQEAGEESTSETAIPDNEPPKELENNAIISTAETGVPSEDETSTSASYANTLIIQQEPTETEAAQETENLEANPTNNPSEGGAELLVNNESTIAAGQADSSGTTESKLEPEKSESVPTTSLPEEGAAVVLNSESTSATNEGDPLAPVSSKPETENSNNDSPIEKVTNVTDEVASSDSNSEVNPEASAKPELNPETTSELPLVPTNSNSEAENSEATATNKLPQEGVTNVIDEVAPSEPTDSKPSETENSEAAPTINLPEEGASNVPSSEPTDSRPEINPESTSESVLSPETTPAPELNPETTSNLSNPSPEPTTETNNKVTSEREPNITDSPKEDPSTTTISPCTEVGDIPHPTNCRKYLSCSGNTTDLASQELQCPERSAFNPLVRRCTRDLSPCLNEEPICLRTSSIPNPNGENSSYFWCIPSLLGGFHKYHIQCSQNEIFTPLLGRCWVTTPLGLGLGLLNPEPSDRDLVRAEWKLLRREIKMKAREEKLRKKLEEKAKARAEKLAAKKQKEAAKKVDDNDSEEDDD